MKFVKMHGIGNDYIYIDCFAQAAPEDPYALAEAMSRQHFGIGSDGLATGIFSNSYYPPVPVRDITLILPGKTATALNGGKLELQQNGEDLTIKLDELKAYEAILIE